MNKLNKGKFNMKTYLNSNDSNFTTTKNGDIYFKVKHYDLNNNYTHYTWKTIPTLNMYTLYK